jgi:methyl-accepting chemotaxis protein
VIGQLVDRTEVILPVSDPQSGAGAPGSATVTIASIVIWLRANPDRWRLEWRTLVATGRHLCSARWSPGRWAVDDEQAEINMIDTAFRPAWALMGRLKYAYKIIIVASVLLVPLGFVVYAYLGIQQSQVEFSAKERVGVAFARPVTELLVLTVDARHRAVAGQAVAAGGFDAVTRRVDAVDAEHGQTLGVSGAWASAKRSLSAALGSGVGRPAFDKYGEAAAALEGLTVAVADASNLTLDPDLDSYYLMDAVVFRLPGLLDAAGRVVDQAILAQGGDQATVDAARIALAVDSGAIRSALEAVDAGMQTAFDKTAAPTLRTTSEPAVKAVHDALTATLAQVTSAASTGRLADVTVAQGDQARAAVGTVMGLLPPQLDDLLATRIDGFEAKARTVQLITIGTLVLAGYLLVGFYRSTTVPLARMVSALGALAQGDVTRAVPIDTRDEVGRMGTALNTAMANLRESIQAISASAGQVSTAAVGMSEVGGRLQSTAAGASERAAQTRCAATQINEELSMLSSAVVEMASSIKEISRGSADAASVGEEAVAQAVKANEIVARLGESSGEIDGVIKMINSVAEQTNLLALNATIEAARAGDAGKGFAVVASEVKDLAQETTRATEDISRRIDTLKADSTAAIDAIAQIQSVISRISESQTSVASAVEEQTATTSAISRATEGVMGNSQAIVDNIQTVAEGSERTNADAVDTQRSAEALKATGAELQSIVGRFQTGR